jgi:hypothetical protein
MKSYSDLQRQFEDITCHQEIRLTLHPADFLKSRREKGSELKAEKKEGK